VTDAASTARGLLTPDSCPLTTPTRASPQRARTASTPTEVFAMHSVASTQPRTRPRDRIHASATSSTQTRSRNRHPPRQGNYVAKNAFSRHKSVATKLPRPPRTHAGRVGRLGKTWIATANRQIHERLNSKTEPLEPLGPLAESRRFSMGLRNVPENPRLAPGAISLLTPDPSAFRSPSGFPSFPPPPFVSLCLGG
jgi:hypothetical protein